MKGETEMAKQTGKTKGTVVSFVKERETKNTVRYAEQGDETVIGTLYVKKAVAENLPDEFTITLPTE